MAINPDHAGTTSWDVAFSSESFSFLPPDPSQAPSPERAAPAATAALAAALDAILRDRAAEPATAGGAARLDAAECRGDATAATVAATTTPTTVLHEPGGAIQPVADAAAATFGLLASLQAARFDAGDFTGAGKAVVVIDTGFSWRYDQSATIFAYDFSGRDDANASVATLNSHGSWVAQVVTRAARDADIIHLKVFDDTGRGASLGDIEQALRFVIANAARFDIAAVNLSLGFGNATREMRTSLSDEFARLEALDVTTTVAAGNAYAQHRSGVNVLAADPSVVAVSATTSTDRYAGFSQRHDALTDIAALGQSVTVRTLDGLVGTVSGTSFAAPHVAAATAVLQQAADAVLGHALDPDEVVQILQRSGDRVVGASAAAGNRVADIDAAVEYFLANAAIYADDPLLA